MEMIAVQLITGCCSCCFQIILQLFLNDCRQFCFLSLAWVCASCAVVLTDVVGLCYDEVSPFKCCFMLLFLRALKMLLHLHHDFHVWHEIVPNYRRTFVQHLYLEHDFFHVEFINYHKDLQYALPGTGISNTYKPVRSCRYLISPIR